MFFENKHFYFKYLHFYSIMIVDLSFLPEGVYSSMRKLFALILVLTLLPLIPVFAENTAPAEPSVTLSPEEWVKQHVDENTPLSIEVVPYDGLSVR